MSVDYEQLKAFVKEAMFTGGGLNEPSAPVGIPHRMPAADGSNKEQDQGDEDANKMYDVALKAREATEQLVEALDDPVYDQAYEFAFKASANLRKVLNSLEETGAHPMPIQRVVAPPKWQQKYTGGSNAGDFTGGMGMGAVGGVYQEAESFGVGGISQSAHALDTKELSRDISKGNVFQGLDNNERKIIQDIDKILRQVADEGNLKDYRSQLQTVLKNILQKSSKSNPAAGDAGTGAL